MIASDIGCFADGRLFTGKLPDYWDGSSPQQNNWNGNKNRWLVSLINRAHAKGVKVIICVDGDYFTQATGNTYFGIFVANIVNFVNVHGFDGVDIDWERPHTDDEWNQCIALLEALKDALPSKRITIALPGGTWF